MKYYISSSHHKQPSNDCKFHSDALSFDLFLNLNSLLAMQAHFDSSARFALSIKFFFVYQTMINSKIKLFNSYTYFSDILIVLYILLKFVSLLRNFFFFFVHHFAQSVNTLTPFDFFVHQLRRCAADSHYKKLI